MSHPMTPAMHAWHTAIAWIGTHTLAGVPQEIQAAIVADPEVQRLHDALWESAQGGDEQETREAGKRLNGLVKRRGREAQKEVAG